MCTLEKRGRVYLLTLTGPGDHRFNLDLLTALHSAVNEISTTTTANSALVITGEGKFFSNGFDLAWAKLSPQSRPQILSAAFKSLVAALLALPMPTLAALSGHAAGAALALSLDYRVMRSARGFLYMSELDAGIPVVDYFMSLMRGKVKDSRVLRAMMMSGERVTARRGVEMGIVDWEVEGTAEMVVDKAVEIAEELAGRGWDGRVYAEIRKMAFSEACQAVGMEVEKENGENSMAKMSKL